jgi:ABC-2 type transport system ATP-binding protein
MLLLDRSNDFAPNYSNGMLRSLEIAGDLVHTTKELFLDEQTLACIHRAANIFYSCIWKLLKIEDIMIILATHYVQEVDKLCKRVAIVDHGSIVAMDTPERLKKKLDGETITVKIYCILDL